MPDIFSSKPGRVTAVTGNGLPMNISIGRPPLMGLPDSRWKGYDGFKAIIQSLGISGEGGCQFSHSLRDFIYVYVFGERVGEIQVGGLAFHSNCSESFDPRTSTTGLERVYNYYRKYRITSYPLALTVTIGVTSFVAFLVGMQVGITNPETSMAQFSLRFKYVPDQVDLIPDIINPPGESGVDDEEDDEDQGGGGGGGGGVEWGAGVGGGGGVDWGAGVGGGGGVDWGAGVSGGTSFGKVGGFLTP